MEGAPALAERDSIRVGVRVPPGPPSPRLARLIERLVEGGVDSLWWGDHLMALSAPELWEGAENSPSFQSLHAYSDPFVVMGWCASVAGGATLGTCVTDGIRRMPATLAQSALTLDHAAAGGVVLGLGAGEVANYRPYGWDVKSPAARFGDAARQIRRFLDRPGPDEHGAVVSIRPPDGSAGPRLWLAAHGPRGFALVGECGDGWFPTSMTPEEWSTGRRAVRKAAAEHGRPPTDVTMALSLDLVVQDTHREAVAVLSHPAVKQMCLLASPAAFARYGVAHPLGRSATEVLVPTIDGPALLRAAQQVPDGMVADHIVHGTVDDVVGRIRTYEGLDHVRLSDLSGSVRSGGGTERLLAVTDALRSPQSSSASN